MYKVLLVDDEVPSMRYFQAIITKHFPEFSVDAMLTNGQDALDYLREHRIDLLITDIRMPLIDGLLLSKKARAFLPDLRIIIVSGYPDFDYAKEAISAAVDSYILKPISVTQAIETIRSVQQKLEEKKTQQELGLLPLLASGYDLDSALVERVFSGQTFRFALIRRGNLPLPPTMEPKNIMVLPPVPAWYAVLQGRDENEQIILAGAEQSAEHFAEQVEQYLSGYLGEYRTGSAVYDPQPKAVSALACFIHNSTNAMMHTTVIGKKRVLPISAVPSRDYKPVRIEASSIKYLNYLIANLKQKRIRELLFQLADHWEQSDVHQIDVSRMINQILDCALNHNPLLYDKQEEIITEIHDLYQYSQSYAELISNVYAILFDESYTSKRITSTEDLYDCTVTYIRENFAKPITIQSLSSSIGISQTYISRLFRKHGNTTFNTFLTRCRIDNAIRFMKEHPDTLLRDVAEAVGYEDASYFSRVFRKMTGLTPSEYEGVVIRSDDRQEQPEPQPDV